MKNTTRACETMNTLFHNNYNSEESYLASIICSPSDVGVMRNSGRNGSRYAPEAIINRVKKFNRHIDKSKKILLVPVTDQNSELEDFEDARNLAIEKIKNINNSKITIHLGGGHDQIFPLLMGLDARSDIKNLVVINIDAHCDTRIEEASNSGTPFRDFDLQGKKPFHLIQYGIQDYSNSITTLSKLQRGSEEKHFIDDIAMETKNFSQLSKNIFDQIPFQVNKNTAVIFSLDCDGIDGTNMKAVSAVNPNGLPMLMVSSLAKLFNENFKVSQQFYGIYEFNPVYEDSSLYSTKVISSLVFDILKFK